MIPDEICLPGEIADAQLIADRRGSRIWKIILTDRRQLALKYATRNDSAQGIQEAAPLLAAREAAVLAHVGRNGYLYASGTTERGTWIAVEWIEGPTLMRCWRGVRNVDDQNARTEAVAATWLATEALAGLHARGWRHADLQNDHILVSDSGSAHLIDFALAQGPVEVNPRVIYRGGLAQLTAPEIAIQLLDTPADQHIVLAAEAEVYMFGAVLFAAWTGHWPIDYGVDPRELTLDQIYARNCQRRRRQLPDSWPLMSELIASMLAHGPAQRPTMALVSSALFDQQAGSQPG